MESTDVPADEQQGLERKPKRRAWCWGGCLAILLLLFLFLAVLFYPISKETKKRAEQTQPAVTKGTKYTIISAKRVREIGTTRPTSKGLFLIVTFRVENVADTPRTIDYSMVSLGTEKARNYPIDPQLTNVYYETIDARSPWLSSIDAKEAIVCRAVFNVPRPGTRDFYLYTKDLDFRASELTSIRIGKVPLEE